MDVVDLIRSFSTGPLGSYTVTRRLATPFRRGLAQSTTDAQFSVTASVQPATGQDMLRLPEGRRSNETRVLFTSTQLYTGDQGLDYEADLVEIEGANWDVFHVEDWLHWAGVAGFYRCIVQAPTPGTP